MKQFVSVKLLVRECFYFLPVKSKVKPFGTCGASLPTNKENDNEKTIAKGKQSELSYQTITEILDSIQDDFYVLDRNWNFVFASKRFTGRIGKEPKDFVGNNIWKMFPKHLGTILEENFRATMEKREIRHFEISGKYTQEWYRMTVFPSAEGITVLGTDITERKKAEEALRENEERLKQALDAGEFGLWGLDVITGKAWRTIRHDQIFGYNELLHEWTYQMFLNHVLPEDRVMVDEKFGGALKRGTEWNFECRIQRPSGEERWIWAQGRPKFNEKHAVTQLIGLVKDITERKKAEEALRKQASIIDLSPDAIIVKKLDDTITFWSNGAQTLYGWTKEEAVGQKSRLLFKTKFPEPYEEILEQLKLKGRWSGEKIHQTKSCRTIIVDSRWLATCDLQGEIGEILETNVDITERKKMVQELSNSLKESKQSESEISALLRSSRTVLQNKEFPDSARAIFDACKELLGATAGYVALLSDDGKENVVLFLDSGGLPCTVDPSLPMPIRGLRAEAYNSGKVSIENDFPQSEWQKFSPKGHMRLKNVLFAPLKIEQRTVGVIGLANKLGGFTKRDAEMAMAFGELASVALANSKMLEILEENEKELKMHSEHLERLVEERTKQVKDSERLATIGATAGMVGHDIRNPLQAITGDIYLAKSDLASMPECEGKQGVLESLTEVEKNIDYINKIVADLQDFARPLKPNAEKTDIKHVIDLLLAKNGLPESVKVNVKVESEARVFVADSTFINRIMYNLVNNAVQAMPKGGQLTIHVYKEAKETVISVKDTGVGIPEAVKDKLFTPMFTTKSKGQGFGLAVIKRMTEALGGTVTFVSQEGKGTTFKVRFPPPSKS